MSIAYFLKLRLDINSRDVRESTALHWAAFSGGEYAL
jgi:ankyrin repeat protein